MNFIFTKNDLTFFLSDTNSVVLISQVHIPIIVESCETTVNASMVLKATRWLTEDKLVKCSNDEELYKLTRN